MKIYCAQQSSPKEKQRTNLHKRLALNYLKMTAFLCVSLQGNRLAEQLNIPLKPALSPHRDRSSDDTKHLLQVVSTLCALLLLFLALFGNVSLQAFRTKIAG